MRTLEQTLSRANLLGSRHEHPGQSQTQTMHLPFAATV